MQWLVVLFSLLICLSVRYCDRFSSGTFRILFFDVGQGDAVLLRFPKGEVWLVDAGGGSENWNWGQQVLYRELARMGILTVDVGVLTHPDRDHGMGFLGLMPQITFRELRWNSVFSPTEHPLLANIFELAHSHQVRPLAVSKPIREVVEGVAVRTVPLPAAGSKNDSPLTLWVDFAGCRVLLAGDAEKLGERRLLQVSDGPVDILKLNHHGSQTSTTPPFFARMNPQVAIASVGAGNPYGHPKSSVLHRIAQSRSKLLRTDVSGFIELTLHSGGFFTCRNADGECGQFQCRNGVNI
jgi:competence protein ComEC